MGDSRRTVIKLGTKMSIPKLNPETRNIQSENQWLHKGQPSKKPPLLPRSTAMSDQTRSDLTFVAPPGTDLSDEVTVFVITIHGPDFNDCMAALTEQDCKFKLDVIENIAPMDAAFQQMNERCTTPFFCQIDEDMVLYPHAIRRLHGAMARIVEQTDQFPIICYGLHDTLLKRNLLGVKIYRHEVIKNYPWIVSESCEMDQAERMKKDGYQILIDWRHPTGAIEWDNPRFEKILGLHGKNWTPETAYEWAFNRFTKYRRYPWMGWLKDWPRQFLDRYRSDPTEINKWVLLGTIAGLTCNLDDYKGEKDFRTYSNIPGLQTLKGVF